jgi:hypothetical protein
MTPFNGAAVSATTNFEMKVSCVSSQISYCCRNCGWSCSFILSGIAVVSTLACNGYVLFVYLPSCKYENSYGKIRATTGGEETAVAEK